LGLSLKQLSHRCCRSTLLPPKEPLLRFQALHLFSSVNPASPLTWPDFLTGVWIGYWVNEAFDEAPPLGVTSCVNLSEWTPLIKPEGFFVQFVLGICLFSTLHQIESFFC